MSLFDIIRYGNINLNSYEDLQSLPKELIWKYWVVTNRSVTPEWNIHYYLHDTMCDALANYNPVGGKKVMYDKALKEYSNEFI